MKIIMKKATISNPCFYTSRKNFEKFIKSIDNIKQMCYNINIVDKATRKFL